MTYGRNKLKSGKFCGHVLNLHREKYLDTLEWLELAVREKCCRKNGENPSQGSQKIFPILFTTFLEELKSGQEQQTQKQDLNTEEQQ